MRLIGIPCLSVRSRLTTTRYRPDDAGSGSTEAGLALAYRRLKSPGPVSCVFWLARGGWSQTAPWLLRQGCGIIFILMILEGLMPPPPDVGGEWFPVSSSQRASSPPACLAITGYPATCPLAGACGYSTAPLTRGFLSDFHPRSCVRTSSTTG